MSGLAELVRAHYDAMMRGDFVGWADLLTEDFTVRHATAGETVGRDGYLASVRRYRQSFPDVTVELHSIVEGGDQGAARFTSRATFTEDFLGIEATGRVWELDGMGFYRIQAGRLHEAWFVEDFTGWLRDLTEGVGP